MHSLSSGPCLSSLSLFVSVCVSRLCVWRPIISMITLRAIRRIIRFNWMPLIPLYISFAYNCVFYLHRDTVWLFSEFAVPLVTQLLGLALLCLVVFGWLTNIISIKLFLLDPKSNRFASTPDSPDAQLSDRPSSYWVTDWTEFFKLWYTTHRLWIRDNRNVLNNLNISIVSLYHH